MCHPTSPSSGLSAPLRLLYALVVPDAGTARHHLLAVPVKPPAADWPMQSDRYDNKLFPGTGKEEKRGQTMADVRDEEILSAAEGIFGDRMKRRPLGGGESSVEENVLAL